MACSRVTFTSTVTSLITVTIMNESLDLWASRVYNVPLFSNSQSVLVRVVSVILISMCYSPHKYGKYRNLYSAILSVLDPRKCEYLKDYSLDFEHAYMTTYLAS